MSAAVIHHLALDRLTVSSTGSQAERRKHFNAQAIDELAESIKTVGLLNPVVARPVNGHYELVAGERRFLAARKAGLEEIPVSVRDLTDEQVLEVQLIENLQREGLHELAEAEGYESLQKLGHSAEEIAHKLGKSKAYVYARLKLLALGPAPREAFDRGELNASTALLLARIPSASVQREACGKITQGRYDNGPLSFREARDLIEREYMLRLADAPFPTDDEDLRKSAGPCSVCPKRTGNQPELFADIKGGDVCTDPECFKLKREAWGKQQLAKAKSDGKKIITGVDAKKAVDNWGHINYYSGLAKLDDHCYEGGNNKTYKQLLGKDAPTMLLQVPKTGDVIEVIDKAAAIKQLKKDGKITTQPSIYGSAVKPKADPVKAKADKELGDALLAAICAKAPKKLPLELLRQVVDSQLDFGGSDTIEKIFGTDMKKLDESRLYQLLFVLASFNGYGDPSLSELQKVAKDLGIDVKKLQADAKAAAPAKPVAKKKAAAKKK